MFIVRSGALVVVGISLVADGSGRLRRLFTSALAVITAHFLNRVLQHYDRDLSGPCAGAARFGDCLCQLGSHVADFAG